MKTKILGLAVIAGLLAYYWLARDKAPAPAAQAPAEPLLLYCAAGIKPAVEPVAKAFEKEYGIAVHIQYGGSGTLLSNIEVARTGDLFLPADQSYIDTARAKGLIAEVIPLARMRPVLAVRKGNPQNIRALWDLTRDDVKTGLANPDAASIGSQTRRILTAEGWWDAIQSQVEAHGVFKPTVMELANDLKLGVLDAAVLWDAQLVQHPELESVAVPAFAEEWQTLSVTVLQSARDPTTALRFARYLSARDRGLIEFKAHGYRPVDGDDWEWEPEITFFSGAVNRRAIEDAVRRFGEREGVKIHAVYNGCGILTAQMRAMREGRKHPTGFPDTYLACDRFYLENVKDWFQDDVNVSEADIVIVTQKGNPQKIQSLEDLTRPGLRVSVGQPQQCTIGALTEVLLVNEGLYDGVMSNVVMQTASSSLLVPGVVTHSVDASLAYITDTVAESNNVEIVRLASPLAKAVQPFSIAKTSSHKQLGRRMLDALARERVRYEQVGFRFTLGQGEPAP